MKYDLYEQFSDKLACIMIEGVGIIVGKLHPSGTIIKNPRIIQTNQQGVRLASMIGDPDELVLVRPPVFGYKILDKDLKDAYIQSTTSLVIAKEVPKKLEVVK